jgi:transposase
MANIHLSNKLWDKFKAFLETEKHIYLGAEVSCQQFIEALFWMARSGAQWRLLPKQYGNWNTIYKRFSRWEQQGVFKRMMTHFSGDAEFKTLMLDSTITRAHPCAAGALKKTAVRTNRLWAVPEGVSARKFTSWSMPQGTL